ncbi:MAG TPA: zf-HC2 domain-containing protein [Streptosporangiaceae bacterium]|nr:zf-HC2 domain-containing protein [Streptosporangiaceae bacterium]
MTRRDKHPGADQLACLAAGGLPPRRAARVQAHLAQCGHCAYVSQQLDTIGNVLASASYPEMPQNLSARIDAAISREAQQRPAAMPSTEPGRRDLPARRRRGQDWTSWRPLSLPGLPGSPKRLAATVAAVVIAAAGSYLMAENSGTGVTRPPSSALAGAAAPAQHLSPGPYVTYGQPASLDTVRAVQSPTNFVAARLRVQAISALNTAETLGNLAAQPSASRAAHLTASAAAYPSMGGPAIAGPSAAGPRPSELAGCVRRIATGRTVLLIDIARYQGKPAAVIVTGATVASGAEAWVVGSSCSARTSDVLTEAPLGNP